MRYFLLLTTLTLYASRVADLSQIFDGETNTKIAGCIDPRTGEYFISETDLVVPGLQPLHLSRTFTSKGEGEFHWSISGASRIDCINGTCILYEQGGGCARYKHTSSGYVFDDTLLQEGWHKFPSHPINFRAYTITPKEDTFIVTTSSGAKRIYKKGKYISTDCGGYNQYILHEEVLPNKKVLQYQANDHRVNKVSCLTPDKKHTYNSIYFSADCDTARMWNDTGDSVLYTYKNVTTPRHLSPSIKSKNLRTVKRNTGAAEEQLHYYPSLPSANKTKLIKERNFGEQRGHKVTYHLSHRGHSKVPKECKAVCHDAPEKGFVKELQGRFHPHGDMRTLYSFLYKNRQKDSFAPTTVVHDAEGGCTTFIYNQNGTLERIEKKHPQGGNITTWYTWDSFGNLATRSIRDQKNILIEKTTYTYDAEGINLLSYKTTADFTHDGLTTQTVEYTYSDDAFRNITEKKDSLGNRETFAYLPDSNLIAAHHIYKNGILISRTKTTYNDLAEPTLITQDLGELSDTDPEQGVATRKQTEISYYRHLPALQSVSYYCKEKNDFIHSHTTYSTYNKKMQLTQKETIYDDQSVDRIRYSYDDAGNCIQIIDPLSRITTMEYNPWDECVVKREGDKGYTQKTEYNLIGQIDHHLFITDANEMRSERYTYTPLSRIATKTDYLGNTTRYTYDSLGKIRTQTDPKTQDHADYTTTFEYDIYGNITKSCAPDGKETRTTYTVRGDIIESHPPTGPPTTTTYHPDGRIDTQTTGRKTERYHYDYLGRLIKKELLENDSPVSYTEENTYKNGMLIAQKKAGQPRVHFTYDHKGRLIQETRGSYTKHFIYDVRDNCAETREFLKGTLLQITQTEYDKGHRIIKKACYNGSNELIEHTENLYDNYNNCILTKQKTGDQTHINSWTYDGFGRITSATNAKGETTTHLYKTKTENGFLCEKECIISPRGEKTIITKDPHGNIIKKAHFGIDNNKLFEETKTYTITGALDTHTYKGTHTLTLTNHYNEKRQLISTIETFDGNKKNTSYTYNHYGEHTSTTKPSGTTLYYTYDILGNITHATSSDGTIDDSFTYNYENKLEQQRSKEMLLPTIKTYTESGYLAEEKHGNGLTIAYKRNDLGQLTRQTYHRQTPIQYTYEGLLLKTITYKNHTHTYETYDLLGNLTQETTPFDETITYTHSPLSQTTACEGSHLKEYTPHFDASGNLLTQILQIGTLTRTTDYAYNTQNQLIQEGDLTYNYDTFQQITNIHGNQLTYNGSHLQSFNENTYTYDQDGRRIQKNTTTYTYDAYDRLTDIANDTITIHNTYDAENRLITQTKNGETTHYLYDSQTEVASYQNNTLQDARILGLSRSGATGAAILIEKNNTIYSVQNDIFGSIIALKTANTFTLHHNTAFGKNNTETIWSYKSKRYDPDTKLYHFGHRFYDPETQQWLTPDPLSHKDAPNLYQFLLNNPFTHDDELGLSAHDVNDIYHLPPDIHQYGQILPNQLIGRDQYQNIPASSHLFCPYEESLGGYSSITDLRTATDSSKYALTTGGNRPEVYCSINGICTPYESAVKNAIYCSRGLGNTNIDIIHNHSHGFLNDMKEAALNLYGYPTKPVKLLMEHASSNYNAGIKTHYIVHSQAAAIYLAAVRRLPQPVRENMTVVAVAGAIRIPNEVCKKAYNILSRDDIVPRAGGLHAIFADTFLKGSLKEYLGTDTYTSLGKYTKNATYSGGFVPRKDIFVEDHIDHNFQSKTYETPLYDYFKNRK